MKKILFFISFAAVCSVFSFDTGIAGVTGTSSVLMQGSSHSPSKVYPSMIEGKNYVVKAVVKKLSREEATITLKHDKIKGYMPAMTMAFPVSKPGLFDQVQIGDKGLFTVYVYKGLAKVTSFKLLKTNAMYACPMHPEETSGKHGKCAQCGMNLLKQK